MADSGNAVLEAVGQLRAGVEEIKKGHATKAEVQDAVGKLEPRLQAIEKAFQDEVKRASHTTGRGNWRTAAEELFEHGAKSIRDLSRVGDKQNPLDVKTFVHDAEGHATTQLAVSKDLREALVLADYVYLADALKSRVDRQWIARKMHEGEEKTFKAAFPGLGERYGRFVDAFKALATGTATGGQEWIPTGFSSNLLDEIRLALPELNAFGEITMPTNPWVNPILSGIGTTFIKTENATASESNLTTRKQTWTAKAFANLQIFSDEVAEDSIIAILPTVRANIIRSLGEGLCKAIVNGDPDGTHIDNDTQGGAANLVEKALRGLRKYALDAKGTGTALSHDVGGGALTIAAVGAAMAKLKKFGQNPRDRVLFLTTGQLLTLMIEASSPILTMEKFGPAATIVTGELARIWGSSIFTSFALESRSGSVASTGVNTVGGPNTLGTALWVNAPNFKIGNRRSVTIEDWKDIKLGQTVLVGTARYAFESIEGDPTDANHDPSAKPAVVPLRNFTV